MKAKVIDVGVSLHVWILNAGFCDTDAQNLITSYHVCNAYPVYRIGIMQYIPQSAFP